VLILTPLAVSAQTVREAQKFGIDCQQSRDGKVMPRITVTNYEKLHLFKPEDFRACLCDESSILKNFEGATKDAITNFSRKLPFRLLCTATAAPNDYIELGTSSEALGELGYMDMLGRFFKNAQNSLHPSVYRHRGMDFARLENTAKFRFRGHSEPDFWRWVCSWARACRKPSDMGFSDDAFILPPLNVRSHIVKAERPRDGYLFDVPAVGLQEQRADLRNTLTERVGMVAELINTHDRPAVAWCNLNSEGKMLARSIRGAVEVCGDDSDEQKEESFTGFIDGKFRVLVSKPSIAGLGLNLQHCAHETFFPSHSYEQYYQAVRRCWRFGQKNPVTVDMIATDGQADVLKNLERKTRAADAMFTQLVGMMYKELKIERTNEYTKKGSVPSWM
jgi:hypothetical protein